MALFVQGGGFEFNIPSVGGTWSWRVLANNQQGVGQLFQVTEINTPYGPLVNAQIPLPGDVVTAMADSLVQVQQQLSPLLALVQPAQTSFTVTITEGDPNSAVGTVSVQNAGAFGSFMSVTATLSVPWLQASPASFQGLGRNEQATFNISILAASLLSSASPYSGTIVLQDDRNPPTAISIIVNVVVLPRPVIAATPVQINLTFVLSTNTPGSSQQLQVMNSGPLSSVLNFTLAKLNNASPWLNFVPSSGGPLAPLASSLVTFSIVTAGVPRTPGTYKEKVRISSLNAANSPVDIDVNLVVSA